MVKQDVRIIRPKILSTDLVFSEKVVTIISAYGPKNSRSKQKIVSTTIRVLKCSQKIEIAKYWMILMGLPRR